MSLFLRKILSLVLLIASISIQAQDTTTKPVYRIANIGLDRTQGKVKLQIDGKLNGLPYDPDSSANVRVYENDVLADTARIDFIPIVDDQSQALTVLFLLDVSGSMGRDSKLIKAKEAIGYTLESTRLPPNFTYISWFDSEISDKVNINLETYDSIISQAQISRDGSRDDTDLYFSIERFVEELRPLDGEKVLIVLSDGRNDIVGNKYYDSLNRRPRTNQEIFDLVQKLPTDFRIFTVGLGLQADNQFLRQVSEMTPNQQDTFLLARGPENFANTIQSVGQQVGYNFEILYEPPVTLYEGRARELRIEFLYNGEWTPLGDLYSFGSAFEKINLERVLNIDYDEENEGKDNSPFEWLVFVLGALILLVFLLIFIFIGPEIRRSAFRKKFVLLYKERPAVFNNQQGKYIDPGTGLEFLPNDEIVTRCPSKNVMLYQDWLENGGRCTECRKRTNCDVKPINQNFFHQKDGDRERNWLWFGMLAGLIGWLLYKLIRLAIYDFLYDLAETEFLNQTDTFITTVMVGTMLGASISFFIPWVEELGQSRQLSWARVFLRMLIGTICALAIFLSISWLMHHVETYELVKRAVAWLLFGTVFGMVLSIRSSIQFGRAVLGGALASAIGFAVFETLSDFIANQQYGQLLAFMAYGSVLGLIIIAVVSYMEDFIIEYQQAGKLTGQARMIGKWLRNDIPVRIGKSHSCEVFVKWDDWDGLQDVHAEITLERRVLYIKPSGETLINERQIEQKTMLKDMDVIRLGNKSSSQFRIVEKKKNTNARVIKKPKPKPKPTSTDEEDDIIIKL